MKFLILLILTSAIAFSEETPAKLPAAAARAVAAYDAQVAKAHAAYVAAVHAEQEKVGIALYKEMDVLTKKGDLDGAIAIKAKIAAIAHALPEDTDAFDAPTPPARTLVITKVKYGIEGKFIDITKFIRDNVKDNSLSFSTNAIDRVVGDPAFGEPKSIIVDYILNGKADTITVIQGGMINIPKK